MNEIIKITACRNKLSSFGLQSFRFCLNRLCYVGSYSFKLSRVKYNLLDLF